MINLPDVSFPGVEMSLVNQAKGMVEGDRMRKRLLGLMENSKSDSGSGSKEFRLDFLKSPTACLPRENGSDKVGAVEWEKNDLLVPPAQPPSPPASQDHTFPEQIAVARPTGEKEVGQTDMVIESVGYRSEPLALGEAGFQLLFDLGRGRIRNIGGRVVDEGGSAVSWSKALIRDQR